MNPIGKWKVVSCVLPSLDLACRAMLDDEGRTVQNEYVAMVISTELCQRFRRRMMAAMSRNAAEPKEEGLVITRVFDAPRELVWKSWTEPERVKRWWGTKVFTAPSIKIDLRVGANYHYCMRSPDGKDYWSTGVFREIVPLERIVATDSFAAKEGNNGPGPYYGMSGDFPLEMILTVTFEELEGKTRLTLHHTGMPSGTDSDLARQGWNESLDKLAAVLAAAKV